VAALLGAISLVAAAVDARSSRGVVVEEVEPGGNADRAGVKPGDVLEEMLGAHGASWRFGLPFDVRAAEIEEGARGAVTLKGKRGSRDISLSLQAGRWGLITRPLLVGRPLALWQQGRASIGANKLKEGLAAWYEAARTLPDASGLQRAALLAHIGRACADARRFPEAHEAFTAALRAGGHSSRVRAQVHALDDYASQLAGDLTAAESALRRAVEAAEAASRDYLILATLRRSLGLVLRQRGDHDSAERELLRALDLSQRFAPDSLAVADALNSLGVLVASRRQIEEARAYHERAYEIRQRLAPDSLDVALSLNNLADLARERGDLGSAAGLHRMAVAIRERLAPGTLTLAGSLQNLGVLAWTSGDLSRAQEHLDASVSIYEARAPWSLDLAQALSRLGLVLSDRGDHSGAESSYRRALSIYDRVAPGTSHAGPTLNNLGLLMLRRRDAVAAEGFFQRSLEVRRKVAPESPEIAGTLSLLATAARDRGKLQEAHKLADQAVAMLRKVAPDGLDLASALRGRAALLQQEGDNSGAETAWSEALTIYERLAKGGIPWAATLADLAAIDVEGGQLERAQTRLQDALAVLSKLAPGGTLEARAFNTLGRLRRRQGRLTEAAEQFVRALDAIEAQTGRLGGAEDVRAGFGAAFRDLYRDAVDTLVALQRPAEAFQVVERYRARSFLAMLAERGVPTDAELPAELARESQQADAEYAGVQAQLAKLRLEQPDAAPIALLERLRELRDRRAEIARRIREASPRAASLEHVQPLTAERAAEQLDPDTVLLSYFVGSSRTLLFVTSAAAPVRVFELPSGEAALRERVERFRELIQQPTATAELMRLGHELYRELIAPAEARLGASRRVMLIADGPLHRLPFAALVQRIAKDGPHYLAEWRPLYSVSSATVYGELRKWRERKAGADALIAFGDPTIARTATPAAAGETAPTAEAASTAEGTPSHLPPLPHARGEVEAIARLFPERSRVFVGEDASEERLRAEAAGARYLHVASHSLLDAELPINSALVLRTPQQAAADQENGLLQAWEIVEKLRLEAELVTLSACDTGLGKEVGGEGLLGLTRAFQYAGARSVLASLWNVRDESTADLMTRFYEHLRAGRSKAEALQAAQIEMMRTSARAPTGAARGVGAVVELAPASRSHPFRWAGFQLYGDWR
jgi:CHAT domain-containing protein/Tfp pilus assembly protein PilF